MDFLEKIFSLDRLYTQVQQLKEIFEEFYNNGFNEDDKIKCNDIIITLKQNDSSIDTNIRNFIDKIEKLMLTDLDYEGYNAVYNCIIRLNEIVKKLYLSYIHDEDTYNNTLIENYYKTESKKSALIVYIIYPFVFKNISYGHTNQVEVQKMAEILKNLGYNVDIINTRYNGCIEYQKYSLIIGSGAYFEKLCGMLDERVVSIYYLTESSPYFSNVAELKRLRAFMIRNGLMPSFERQSSNLLNLQLLSKADAAICIGNTHTLSTYDGMFNNIYQLNVSGFDNCRLPDLNKKKTEIRKNFLWYGGNGAIHKGLDICIELFRSLPDLRLYIVGEISSELYEFYKDDIENAENLLYYGFLSSDSDEFREVSANCGFCISPSCSEGQSTAVITTMFSGIIPVCTAETGIDAETAGGLLIESLEFDYLNVLLRNLSEMEPDEFYSRQEKVYGYVTENHTIKKYEENLHKILEDILNRKKRKNIKIQFLNGGLANQVFQYIFARHYELSHDGDIMYLDDSYFALNTVHNGYELEKVFNIKPHMLSSCFSAEEWSFILDERRRGKSIPQILEEKGIKISMIAETSNYKEFNPFSGNVIGIPCNEYHPEIMDVQGSVYYHGYWINHDWFFEYRDVFYKEFTFPELDSAKNIDYLSRIKSTNSVSIHIRRGDYVSLGWAYDENIYKKLIEIYIHQFNAKWCLFVFSDDIVWCRENADKIGLTLFDDVVFVEGNVKGKNYIDMQLMSNCKGMIMSNSAFCYLAALLNPNKNYILNPTKREV